MAGDRVHHVAVQGPAAEGQAAGDGKRALRVETEFARRDLHRTREATVDVDEVEVRHLDAGKLQRPAPSEPDGRGRIEVVALGNEVVVDGVGAGEREDHLRAWHPQRPRDVERAEHERRRHVDTHVGVHQLGVGVGHGAVCRRHGADLRGGQRTF